jgi:hypothetical protein
MFILIRTLFICIGFFLAASMLSGAGVGFTYTYAAPKNLSALVIMIVFVGCAFWAANVLAKFVFSEFFKKK